jgi:hypothetical protein
MTDNVAEQTVALKEFHEAFGRALSAWSSVEEGLFEWFKLCASIQNENLARAIFYSARSFAARRDMLVATIPFSPFNKKTREAIRLCLKRARTYSEFRNRFTHGHPSYLQGDHGRCGDEFVFAQGRTYYDHDPDDYITIVDLMAATANFRALADLLLGFHPEFQAPDVCEAGCLAEIQALPNEANSMEPTPIRPQKKQPPQSQPE